MKARKRSTAATPDKLIKVNFLKRNDLAKSGLSSHYLDTSPKIKNSYHKSILGEPNSSTGFLTSKRSKAN